MLVLQRIVGDHTAFLGAPVRHPADGHTGALGRRRHRRGGVWNWKHGLRCVPFACLRGEDFEAAEVGADEVVVGGEVERRRLENEHDSGSPVMDWPWEGRPLGRRRVAHIVALVFNPARSESMANDEAVGGGHYLDSLGEEG